MPEMDFGHTYQMDGAILGRLILMDGNAVEINAVANTDGTLSKDNLGIRERNDGRHLSR